MTITSNVKRSVAAGCCALLSVGCGFDGLNSVALPGAVGRGPGAAIYHVELANIGTLESNSPVMVDNVVVGSVGQMRFDNWHIDVAVSVRPDVAIPANAVATVGQTSLLGSMHVALDPPLGQEPQGRLQSGATIPLSRTASYPSTEQTLASLSALVNGGGLGQIGDIIRSLNTALSGREPQVRELIERLGRFIGVFDSQRDEIIDSLQSLNKLAETLTRQRDTVAAALRDIPPALEVLVQERPRLTDALEKLGAFGDLATRLVNDAGADLTTNLTSLEPTIKALADVGPDLARVLAYLPTAPFNQSIIDRGIRGDYMNLFIIIDLTTARLKRTLLAGTHWEDQDAQLVPAPGDLGYESYYTRNPLGAPISPPPPTYRDSLKTAPPPPPEPPTQGGG